jgi:acetyltransferase-like isoleucine patch superfamily enzyme
VLFARCSILGGIHIGDRAVIGAHALVIRDVPDDGIAKGNEASIHEGAGVYAGQGAPLGRSEAKR